MSQNENFENNRNLHIYNSNENNQNFNSLSNSITDMENNFINLAVSQALTNPFLINNITNSLKLIKKEFPPTHENINNFYKYFEDTWLSLDDNDIPRYPFDIWTYNKKFNFKGTKKVLINEDKLNEYVCFTNNACESFNHLMNSCLSHNTSVSFNKKIENKTFVSDF